MELPPVQYVTTSDGFNIAYAAVGTGRPFVFAPLPFSDLGYYAKAPADEFPMLEGLALRFRLVLFDGRGQGMSTRGLPEGLTIDDFTRDLEAVVEKLALQRGLVLFGYGNYPGHCALRFAAAHPERVAALIMVNSAIDTRAWPLAFYEGLATQNWDLFLRSRVQDLFLRSRVPPGLSLDEEDRFVEHLQRATTQSDWISTMRVYANSSVKELLPRLTMPVLVLHPRDYVNLRPEESMKLAASVPNGRLVLIDGRRMLGDPAQALKAIDDFLASLPPHEEAVTTGPLPASLSLREVEVLRLIAAGRSNPQIADELVISLNTVQRHVSNILDKTGAANRTEAAGYARDKGLL